MGSHDVASWNEALDDISNRLANAESELRHVIAAKGDTSDKADVYRLTGKLQGVRLALDYARGMRR